MPNAGAVMWLGLVPKPHIQMQTVARSSGTLFIAASENQCSGETVRKITNQKAFAHGQEDMCQVVSNILGNFGSA